MKTPPAGWLKLLPLFALLASAQVPPDNVPGVIDDPGDVVVPIPIAIPVGVSNRATYSLELGAWVGDFIPIVPVEPAPATYLAPDTQVILRLSAELGELSNVQWSRNGQPLATGAELVLPAMSSADNGYYSASFADHVVFSRSNTVQLHCGIADRHRIANQSTRVMLSPTVPAATFGFVIEPPVAGSFHGMKLLIRVIGPALAEFDSSSPLADPVYTLQDIHGNDRSPSFEEIGAPQVYRDLVNETAARVGAFPIDSDFQTGGVPRNLVDVINLDGGAYTLTVRSQSAGTGEVLVEIYAVPTTNDLVIDL